MEEKIDKKPNNTKIVEENNINENNVKSKTKTAIDYTLIILSGYLKGLLIPAYKSTDFEVHRNWLAITYSLPLKEWYYEKTSEWTLDYPPFFAWFEYFMSLFAQVFDKNMLNVNNLNYSSFNTILFQRGTVMVTEWVLFAALMRLKKLNLHSGTSLLCYLLFLHPSLFIVDHMHFQYNGFMFGILMWSLILAYEGKNLLAGVIFAILLNFKHIYLYIAPAYFIYLLRGYCFPSDQTITWIKGFKRLFTLGACVVLVFLISFGPFLYYDQLPQVISRLFPFKRGLCHAYWAPNFWALYSFLDRVLITFGKRLFPAYLEHLKDANLSSATRGLIGDSQFFILPNISPIHTLILTVVFQLPCLIKLWKQPNKANFIDSVVLCGYSSYLFGWHVHEKAVMLMIFPMGILSLRSPRYIRYFLFLSIIGSFSLFPLIFHPQENVIQSLLLLCWGIIGYSGQSCSVFYLFRSIEFMNYVVLGFLYFYWSFLHSWIFGDTMEFLPLMLISVACSIGMISNWVLFYNEVLFRPDREVKDDY